MWAVLQWMGRLYVLTDLRILRLCRRVQRRNLRLRPPQGRRHPHHPHLPRKALRLGSIEIIPADDTCLPGGGETVKRPVEVDQKVQATIERAKQGACLPD